MSVENNLTSKNIELARNHPEFQKRHEREQTLVAPTPELFDAFRASALPYEQRYISHPDEEFSLRVRAVYTPEGTTYTATLKTNGEMDNSMLDRLEIPAPITRETYEYYAQSPDFPVVRFLRAEPLPGLSVDFIEGLDLPQVEYEAVGDAPEHSFVSLIKSGLIDRSDDPSVRKEIIAHQLHGKETLKPTGETLETFARRVAGEMVAHYVLGNDQVVTGISGLSGSGKSSAVAEIQDIITNTYGEAMRPLVVSTDDYHRGFDWFARKYEAQPINWDDPAGYDLESLAGDLQKLKNGEPITRRHFDFDLQETVYDGEALPSPFVIVEGLFAGNEALDDSRQLHFEMPVGIATAIGRDVRRLILENRANDSIATPEDRLRYVLEVALPTYLDQKKPKHSSFSASSRPLAERAFMLSMLPE